MHLDAFPLVLHYLRLEVNRVLIHVAVLAASVRARLAFVRCGGSRC